MNMAGLIDHMTTSAQVELGENLGQLTARGTVRAVQKVTGVAVRGRPWRAWEDKAYLDGLANQSYVEIAAKLGRSVSAVKVRYTRQGMPPKSKRPGYLTANQAAKVLGLDAHKVCRWIDDGIMRGERVLIVAREYRQISWVNLKIWATRPENWMRFEARAIKNGSLRSLVLRAQALWGDEWLSTREAADILGCDDKDVWRMIKLGRLYGVRAQQLGGRNNAHWAYWFVRRSHLVGFVVPKGKGCRAAGSHYVVWSKRADAFILRAVAAGETYAVIGRKMRWNEKKVSYRARMLKRMEAK